MKRVLLGKIFGETITDFSAAAYILDTVTVIDEAFRGKGIGTKLMKAVLENENLKDCSLVLATSVQTKKFYESLRFQIKNEKYMLYRVS
ncbi:MAG: GNAT family N-acetyltransferase [Oscillospiraceae bacterium]|jgi:ribosomal protein S18 acetylase RimI-like enzyme|nr:GNAT family N-acetyltransferase [Oscillospiraceae bacterium]